MKLNKKPIFIIGIVIAMPQFAYASDATHDYSLDLRQVALETQALTAPGADQSLANAVNNPISQLSVSTVSRTQNSGVRDNLPASPPFEATDHTVGMTAGTGATSAPTEATVPALSSPETPLITLVAQASDQQSGNAMPDTMSDSPAAKWDDALGRYVKAPDNTGLAKFDYAALKQSSADKAVLRDYIQSLEEAGSDGKSRDETIAYWANLYNAVTVLEVVENYPVSSIKKIKSGVFSSGPWKKDLVTVNGEDMSLDDIEHETLRKKYPSPLIHYMVNCASVGCPNLKDGLWTAETLDSDRETAARAYVNSPRGAQVTEDGLVVSSIYDWFEEDFGGSKDGVLAHLAQYAEGDLKAAIDSGAKIDDYEYDWSLNE